jgi:6-phosphogluconate dehydrogenase
MMLLVMAGKPVDDFIELLLTEGGVEEGDIIIDGGNSHYPDTNRRTKYLSAKGIRFVGSGVSGGEEGARYGPSIMPGGNEEAWPYIKVGESSSSVKSSNDSVGCAPVHLRKVRRRGLLPVGRRRGCWSLRKDGAQRYRVR